MPYKKESDEPLTKEELTDIIFDTTYTMDLENEENAKSYDYLKLKYIALFEVEEKYAYDNAAGPKNPYKYAKDIFDAGRMIFFRRNNVKEFGSVYKISLQNISSNCIKVWPIAIYGPFV